MTITINGADEAPEGGFWIAQQGNSNQSQEYTLEEGHNSKSSKSFNVQFGSSLNPNGSMSNSGDKSISDGESRTITFEITGTADVDDFTFAVSSQHFDVSMVQSGTQLIVTLTNNSGSTQNLTGNPFSVTVSKVDDADADDGETLTLTIVDSIWPAANNFINFVVDDGDAPIAIDLDGDGINYLGLDAGVVFTDQLTGESVNSAWVGPEDGMLVIDANDSGTVDESREYVFTEWSDTAQTDLEAVAEVFDTNQDGVLDAQDEQWDQFAVWQDADSDGVTDEGELRSLGDLGIDSIELNYSDDSVPGTAADGDVTIHGQAVVNFTDGTTGTAEDVTFAAVTVEDLLGEQEDIPLPVGEASEAPSATDSSPVSDTDTDVAALEFDISFSLPEQNKTDYQE